MRSLRFLVPAVAGALLCWGTTAVTAGVPPASVVKLGNGLRVVLAPDPEAMAVDVGVWYPSGSRWEHEGQTGISHLIERLMFRGSAHVADGEHVRTLNAEGATCDSRVTPDYSWFHETVPAEALPLALRLEADRMAGPSLAPATVAAEQRSAQADARSASSGGTVIEQGLVRLTPLVFAGLPYARPLYGRDTDIARLTARDVESWWKAHYGASGAALVIVGRFDPQATLARVRELFGPLPGGGSAQAGEAGGRAPAGPRRTFAASATPVRVVLAGWRLPGAADPGMPALALATEILGGGEHSRLQHAFAENGGKAYVSQAGLSPQRDGSMLWAMVALHDDADSSRIERQLIDEVASVGRVAPGQDELDHARNRLVTREAFASQVVAARAQALGEGLYRAGDLDAGAKRLDAIARATPADVQSAAQRWLTSNAPAIVWLAPAGGGQ